MRLDAYLREQVTRIGTPEERSPSRRRAAVFGSLAVIGVVLIAAFLVMAGTGAHDAREIGDVLLRAGAFALVVGWFGVSVMFDRAERTRRKLIAKYGMKGDGVDPFKEEDYAKAAEALRDFRPMSYEVAERNFGAEAVAILALAKCIAVVRGSAWQRIVSIKAIEEDRAADERDDKA